MTKKSQTKYWNMSAKNNVGTIYIYGDIVGDKWFDEETSANSFKDELNELGDVSTIDLHINSGGGSVFEGFAIYNMLKQHKAKVDVQVDGIAASIASVIAMAGDTISMPKNSYLMIHNASGMAFGTADEMKKQAEILEGLSGTIAQVYVDRSNETIDIDKAKDLMSAETWLTAAEAQDLGLVDEIVDDLQAVAKIDTTFLDKAPERVKELISNNTETTEAIDEANIEKEREYAQMTAQRANNILEETY